MSPPRRPRRLSVEEHTLWTAVTRAIKPLKPLPVGESAPHPSRHPEPAPERHPAPTVPPAARARAAAPPAAPAPAPLERRLRQRIAKGHEPIMRRLDLHGYTQREAHDALVHFLRAAQADGVRIALVVTGKGARGIERDPFAERGVLRRLVPLWLHAPEFRNLVVGFVAAHVGHGGDGALYVRLRRRR